MLGVQRQMSQSTNLGLNYQYTDRKPTMRLTSTRKIG